MIYMQPILKFLHSPGLCHLLNVTWTEGCSLIFRKNEAGRPVAMQFTILLLFVLLSTLADAQPGLPKKLNKVISRFMFILLIMTMTRVMVGAHLRSMQGDDDRVEKESK